MCLGRCCGVCVRPGFSRYIYIYICVCVSTNPSRHLNSNRTTEGKHMCSHLPSYCERSRATRCKHAYAQQHTMYLFRSCPWHFGQVVLKEEARVYWTPVGFEATRGDPIGSASRRLNLSAKVSSHDVDNRMCVVFVILRRPPALREVGKRTNRCLRTFLLG